MATEIKTLVMTVFPKTINELPSHLIPPAIQFLMSKFSSVLRMKWEDHGPNDRALYLEFLTRDSASQMKKLVDNSRKNEFGGLVLQVDWSARNVSELQSPKRAAELTHREPQDDKKVVPFAFVNLGTSVKFKMNRHFPWQMHPRKKAKRPKPCSK